MIPMPPHTPAVFTAYLVGFYSSQDPSGYRDAGIYSEESPTFFRPGMQYDFDCDKSSVIFAVQSRRSFGRALEALKRVVDERPDLAFVKAMHTYRTQHWAQLPSGTVLVGRAAR